MSAAELPGKEENAMLSNTAQFVAELVANDEQNFTTEAQAAAAFAKAFSSYFGNVVTPPLLLPDIPPGSRVGSNANPVAVAALTTGLTLAFKGKDPATVAIGIHTAIAVNYLLNNVTLIFAGASLVTAATPLAATLVPAMSALQSDSTTAKTVLAATLLAWLSTITVTVGTAAIPLT